MVRYQVPENTSVVAWLTGRRDGVFLLRLSVIDGGCQEVDHVIFVDSTALRVDYPAELNLQQLRAVIFDVCVGDEATLQGVTEIYELSVPPQRKRKKYSKKSVEKRLELRKRKRMEKQRSNINH